MYTLFVIGNIASGKSSACRYLQSLGGRLIDMDELAKSLYVPGSDLVAALAEEFGDDVVAEDGGINRKVLASRCFVDDVATERLNALVHPYLMERLGSLLVPPYCCFGNESDARFIVVEISVAKAAEEVFSLADDILAICAPLELRRARAIGRGMDPADFNRRAQRQESEDELRSMATFVIDNIQGPEQLYRAIDAFLASRNLVLTGDSHAR